MYVTVFTRTIKRRKTGIVEKIAQAYETKSLTPMHAHLRATNSTAKTYADPKAVFTNFIPGIPLEIPVVRGGTLVT